MSSSQPLSSSFLQNDRKIKKAEQSKERKNRHHPLSLGHKQNTKIGIFFNVNGMSICCLFVFNAFQPNYKRPQCDNMFFWFSVKQHNGKISEKNRRPLRYWQKSRQRVVTNLFLNEFHSTRLKLTLKVQLPQVTFLQLLKPRKS